MLTPRQELLLRKVVDDDAGSITLIPSGGDWLYHPYDGGVDVVAPSTEAQDVVRGQHRGWLSSHPRGL